MKQYIDYEEYYYPDENYYVNKKVKKSFWEKVKDFFKKIYHAVRDFFVEYVIENLVEFFVGPVPGFFIIYRIIKHIGERVYEELREVFVDNNNYERYIHEDQDGEKYILTEHGQKVYLNVYDRRYWYVQGTGAQLYINKEDRIVYYDNWNNLKYFDNYKILSMIMDYIISNFRIKKHAMISLEDHIVFIKIILHYFMI